AEGARTPPRALTRRAGRVPVRPAADSRGAERESKSGAEDAPLPLAHVPEPGEAGEEPEAPARQAGHTAGRSPSRPPRGPQSEPGAGREGDRDGERVRPPARVAPEPTPPCPRDRGAEAVRAGGRAGGARPREGEHHRDLRGEEHRAGRAGGGRGRMNSVE